MAVYITGDTHGVFSRFSYKNWPGAKNLTENDTVIITGDCGILWSNEPDKPECYWRSWLSEKPWTTAFIDGNHENHPRLQALPQEPWCGGTVGVVEKNVLHLRRGEVYTIQGKKFFTFGGASSIDKATRTPGVSWWPEELPSYAETDYGLSNLEKHQYSVDYIITHTLPQEAAELLISKYRYGSPDLDPTRVFLQHVSKSCVFDTWYCGHWHEETILGKYHILYEKIEKIL
jgi:hypothetical protein